MYASFSVCKSGFQFSLYFIVGMVVRCLECSDRCSGDFGNVFVFHFVKISEIEDKPLLLRQPLNRLVEFALDPVAVKERIGIDFLYESFGRGIHLY